MFINKRIKPLWNFSLAYIMDKIFVSRVALRKRKARENESPSQRETRLAKQRKRWQQKRARENDDE